MARLSQQAFRTLVARAAAGVKTDPLTGMLVDTVAPGELRDDVLALVDHVEALEAELAHEKQEHQATRTRLAEITDERDSLAAWLHRLGHL